MCDRTDKEKIQALNTQLEQAGSEALAAIQAWDEAIAALVLLLLSCFLLAGCATTTLNRRTSSLQHSDQQKFKEYSDMGY